LINKLRQLDVKDNLLLFKLLLSQISAKMEFGEEY